MSITKSHKSRKTETPGKPRQRKTTEATAMTTAPVTPSPVEGSSSLVPVTTAPLPPIDKPAEQITDVPTELPKEQQVWYRKPDSPVRKKAEKIAVMRAAGRKVADIAKRVGVTEGRVRVIEYLARKNGWYDDDDEPVDLEAEFANSIDRKIVRNISSSLDGQMTNWQTHEMTIAAAKGRGHFKNHDNVQVEGQMMQVVAIRIEMPALGAEHQVVNEENIGGVPAFNDAIEGEVVSAPRLESGVQKTDPAPVQREPEAL